MEKRSAASDSSSARLSVVEGQRPRAAGRRNDAPLRAALQLLWRRKWFVLQALVLVPVVAGVLAARQPSVYEASASVLLSDSNLGSILTGVASSATSGTIAQTAETQAELARVPAVAERAMSELHLPLQGAATLLGESTVTQDSGTDLLIFTVDGGDPTLVTRLATAYARAYTQYRYELDTRALTAAERTVAINIVRLERGGVRDAPLLSELRGEAEELQTFATLQVANASLASTGADPRKVAPNLRRSVFVGLVFGLVLGCGVAALREALDTRVRSTREVSDRLGLPLLARLPASSPAGLGAGALAMLHDPGGAEAEGFRLLRTNIELALVDRTARTIMVTSATDRAMKSATIANVAVAWALAGRRVIVVDLDLRNPSLHDIFGVAGTSGLTEVAHGRRSLDDVLAAVRLGRAGGAADRCDRCGGLQVLPLGPPPLDPGEFVGTPFLGRLLEELRERADLVLVDSPPVLQVADALVLSARADAVVVVARLDLLSRTRLNELDRVLRGMPTRVAGVVLTGVQKNDAAIPVARHSAFGRVGPRGHRVAWRWAR